ncbi:gephyrin-like molybdotransferase Glp [Sinomonas sp. ASV322]|uniref:molybdopterin molybdotransferase MoeA n=1 Tax=Sinomonas sp. ASV322 TaxID=3041920 RepID=UPI0027DE9AC7|nr:gephyrin-like molybdotransferase Glp [Sinomonas sp. ASV322]MDQ4502697.1 molybdopterin molybdotransferase MoeA [Sinomonas sp. ASV322]
MGRSVSAHRAAIRELLAPLAGREPEIRALDDALGLALASDLRAPVSLPPFDNSQMDGFAVRAADFALAADGAAHDGAAHGGAADGGAADGGAADGGAADGGAAHGGAAHDGAAHDGRATLREFALAASIPAGSVPVPLPAGHAAPIMTGAMLPEGADAVVPVERAVPPRFPESVPSSTTSATSSTTSASGPVLLPETESGTFVRRLGSDVAEGAVVLAAGTRLGPAQLGLAAGLGLTEVTVRMPPRVAIVSTGAELAEPGASLLPGQIHDANGTLLAAALREAGLDARATAVRSDEPTALRDALAEAATWADLIVTTGGVSKGAFEATKLALADEPVDFVHLAMQPGGPQGIGTVHGVPFLGLPGNPVSCWVSWEILVRPVLAELLGAPAPRRRIVVPLAEPLDSPSGKLQVRRARLEDGAVALVGGPGSHLLGALATSDALVLVPEDVTDLPAGADVEVWLL